MELPFPVLKDPGNKIADRFGAVRTPEVFVLDEDRTVRYWGRIDDQYGIGFQKQKANRNDLEVAIDELLAGKAVSQPTTEVAGCLIGRVKRPMPSRRRDVLEPDRAASCRLAASNATTRGRSRRSR